MSDKNNRGNYLLSSMDDKLHDGNINLSDGQEKNHVNREKLSLEMSELQKPIFRTRETNLFEAVRDGIVDVVKERLLKRQHTKHIDKLDQSGLAMLHQAARYNRISVAQTLLDHGARIDVRTREENLTPLQVAAR